MKKYTVYHNPRCRKSREVVKFLEEACHSYEVVQYLDGFFTKESLQEVLNNIRLKPSEIVRKNESEWKNILNRNTLNEAEILELLIKYPRLIERPIVISGNKGVLARPIENLALFLKAN
jgi:arsenate reductase|tara:strand:- start:1314 stop:1670 length:357 start_codon:yes stop_codon:yes gene_type:complete